MSGTKPHALNRVICCADQRALEIPLPLLTVSTVDALNALT